MDTIKLFDKTIGPGNPVYIIAEVGINHNGDHATAMSLIDEAKRCGADCVKFQKRNLKYIYSSEVLASPHTHSIGLGVYIPVLKQCELDIDAHRSLKEYCGIVGIDYLCTPFDVKSAEELESIGVKAYKVASCDLKNYKLIEQLIGYNKPLLLSTGMSRWEDIGQTNLLLNTARAEYMFLHCTSTYPTDFKDVNLSLINKLKEYHSPVGYSGHERGVEISVCAVAMGASVIERHFTLDRTQAGPDHACSIEPIGFGRMARHIRDFELARGNGVKRITRGEQIVRETLGKEDVKCISEQKVGFTT